MRVFLFILALLCGTASAMDKVAFTEVDAIKAVKTGNKGGHGDVPNEDVIIEKAVAI